jgi:hypothetical protein
MAQGEASKSVGTDGQNCLVENTLSHHGNASANKVSPCSLDANSNLKVNGQLILAEKLQIQKGLSAKDKGSSAPDQSFLKKCGSVSNFPPFLNFIGLRHK